MFYTRCYVALIIMELEMWNEYVDYHGINVFALKTKNNQKHIVLLRKKDDGFLIEDGSDGYCRDVFSKEDVLKIIDEMTKWVNAT